KEYEWKKVLSKGTQKINGKKYYVTEDLYDVVRKGVDYKVVLKDGRASIDYNRSYINDSYGPPSVKVETPSTKKITQKKHHGRRSDNRPIIMTASILLIAGIILLLTWLIKRKKK
ncbi:DUF1958 domain-containing protein, partial [Mammaliicoccus sciuri]|uniref:DUF1958 domain-containing protein n=1 Tax=Mammaliicoccus sciuri TaxID=1296 RepID=UPI00226E2313